MADQNSSPVRLRLPSPSFDARVVRTRRENLDAVLEVVIAEGWEAVTHPHLARLAGYSKATVYKHWPMCTDLLREAMTRLGEIPHNQPVGDLRSDLIGELTLFRLGMEAQLLRGRSSPRSWTGPWPCCSAWPHPGRK